MWKTVKRQEDTGGDHHKVRRIQVVDLRKSGGHRLRILVSLKDTCEGLQKVRRIRVEDFSKSEG